MPELPDGVVDTCVTSPPYFNLRNYGMAGQIGIEGTPSEYIARMVAVMREVRRVLKPDGTAWVNIGDSYRKDKSLAGIPWRLAFALQEDGWYLRCDVIWHKPNAMPDGAMDRPTRIHEYIFLLSKSARYYYDADSIREPHSREWWTETVKPAKIVSERNDGGDRQGDGNPLGVNKRSVWSVATQPYHGAHAAAFPPDLIRPCILAGSPADGLVLDPFMGSGTTARVALEHGRHFVGYELNPEYCNLIRDRLGLFGEGVA
jgi:site-specific DNA-methyltransferase (adenine-specific)